MKGTWLLGEHSARPSQRRHLVRVPEIRCVVCRGTHICVPPNSQPFGDANPAQRNMRGDDPSTLSANKTSIIPSAGRPASTASFVWTCRSWHCAASLHLRPGVCVLVYADSTTVEHTVVRGSPASVNTGKVRDGGTRDRIAPQAVGQ